jgi:xyloglucan fucosyltransferase
MAKPQRGARAGGVVRIVLLLSVPLLLLLLLSGDRRLLKASDSEFLGLINRRGKLFPFAFANIVFPFF